MVETLRRLSHLSQTRVLLAHRASPLVQQLIKAAVTHCRRWETANVIAPFEHLHLVQGEMPLLRNLTLGPSTFAPNRVPLTLFDQAPQLRNMVLNDSFLKSTMNLPWAQLTHLVCESVYGHECTAILRDATGLIVCTFKVCWADDDTDVGPAVPAHVHLRDLFSTLGDDDVQLWDILEYLTLPVLRTLQVEEPGITLECLAAFPARSQCALDELSVIDATSPESMFREVLPTFGRITLIPYNDDMSD
ncbi:hypothetical protein B0H19DRAFT_1375598 [Mycena capillaripes]|nr:hypothetical protein B0H19DRAFT_1375598 [Mycena capillaripes]